MAIVKFLKEKMIYIVFILMFISSIIGIEYRNVFISLKFTLPVALFMMLFHSMVNLDLSKIVKKRTAIKFEYLGTLTLFYTILFPFLTYLFVILWAKGAAHIAFYSTGSNMTIATAIAISTLGSLAAVGTALGGPFSGMILMMLFVGIFQRMKV